MIRLRILISTAVMLLASAAAPVTFACSGGGDPLSLNQLVAAADVFVRGEVIQTDEMGVNAVIRVYEYLKGGSGPRHLLWYRTDPALMAVHYLHGFDTGCLYGGHSPTVVGLKGYFSLTRRWDGSYGSTHYFDTYVSLFDDVFILNENPRDEYDYTRVDGPFTDEQIRAWAAEFSGESPQFPLDSRALPWFSPLTVATSTGGAYLLPIDGGQVVAYDPDEAPPDRSQRAYPAVFDGPPICRQAGCRIYTPDRALFAEIAGDGVVRVNYPYSGNGVSTTGEAWMPLTVPGEAFSLSPSGETLAVWSEGGLSLYRLTNTFCNCMYAGNAPDIIPVAAVQLASSGSRSIRWSADGSTLVYADAGGLWLLDVMRGGPAHLLAASPDGDVLPLHVSQRGRYVSYRTDRASRRWVMLDRATGETFDNLLPAPGETMFAFFDDGQAQPPAGALDEACVMCVLEFEAETPLLVWFDAYGGEWAWSADCGPGTPPNGCRATMQPFNFNRYVQPHHLVETETFATVLDFDFEPHMNLLAVVKNAQRIQVGDVDIDLSGRIEGDIVDIYWNPPLFFYWDQ